MVSRFIKLTSSVLVMLPVLASAQVYRWVDESGKVHYGDKPPLNAKVEKRNFDSVATPFRKIPSDIYAKKEAPEKAAEGKTPADPAPVNANPEDVPPLPLPTEEADNAEIDEDLMTDEEKEAQAEQKRKEIKKLKEDYEKVKQAYRDAKKEQAAKAQ